MIQSVKTRETPKPKNPLKIKEAITLGKKLSKTPDITKVSVATQMFDLIHDESRKIVAKAFMEGANLTEKGSMTYYYNCRRKFRQSQKQTHFVHQPTGFPKEIPLVTSTKLKLR